MYMRVGKLLMLVTTLPILLLLLLAPPAASSPVPCDLELCVLGGLDNCDSTPACVACCSTPLIVTVQS